MKSSEMLKDIEEMIKKYGDLDVIFKKQKENCLEDNNMIREYDVVKVYFKFLKKEYKRG